MKMEVYTNSIKIILPAFYDAVCPKCFMVKRLIRQGSGLSYHAENGCNCSVHPVLKEF